MNGFKLVSSILNEARFSISSAKKLRDQIMDLRQQLSQETDFAKRKELLWRLKKKQSDLALKPNRQYDYYRTYSEH